MSSSIQDSLQPNELHRWLTDVTLASFKTALHDCSDDADSLETLRTWERESWELHERLRREQPQGVRLEKWNPIVLKQLDDFQTKSVLALCRADYLNPSTGQSTKDWATQLWSVTEQEYNKKYERPPPSATSAASTNTQRQDQSSTTATSVQGPKGFGSKLRSWGGGSRG